MAKLIRSIVDPPINIGVKIELFEEDIKNYFLFIIKLYTNLNNY